MLRWLLSLLLKLLLLQINGFYTKAEALSEPNVLGRNLQESFNQAQYLSSSGEKALQQGHYPTASHLLERLIQEHPGYPQSLRAHYLLGQALRKQQKPQKAIEFLKIFIDRGKHHSDFLQAHLELCQAYLDAHQPQQAYAFIQETDQLASSQKTSQEVLLQIQILTSQSLLHLKKYAASLQIARQIMRILEAHPEHYSEITQQQTYALLITIHLQQCKPLQPHLQPRQILNQINRRALCLKESMLIYQKLSSSNLTSQITFARQQLQNAWEQYHYFCKHPVKSSASPNFKKEIQVWVQPLCQKTLQEVYKTFKNSHQNHDPILESLNQWLTES